MIELTAPHIPVKGTVTLPISKSLANRQLILHFLQKRELSVSLKNEPDDVRVLKTALNNIIQNINSTIDVGHAGTAMRFLCACLATQNGTWTLTGSARMQERPIDPLVTALKELGADITYLNNEGFPPLKIIGKKLNGNKISIPANFSSQFISALMLIAPFMEQGLEIALLQKPVSEPYLQMTVKVLEHFGVKILQTYQDIKIEKGIADNKVESTIEADWSAASYFYSLVALSPGAQVRLKGLNENSFQGDAQVQSIYQNLGVQSTFENETLILTNQKSEATFFKYDCINCPDLAQTIALTCLGLGIPAHLTGLQTLKIKETDRLIALKNEMEKFGATVTITHDSLKLLPRTSELTENIRIETYHDHRMAMSFAPMCLLGYTLNFADQGVVSKSYPAFWEHLISLGFNVNLRTL